MPKNLYQIDMALLEPIETPVALLWNLGKTIKMGVDPTIITTKKSKTKLGKKNPVVDQIKKFH